MSYVGRLPVLLLLCLPFVVGDFLLEVAVHILWTLTLPFLWRLEALLYVLLEELM
jgi:hypothetical protein